jgi:hypothetical protein
MARPITLKSLDARVGELEVKVDNMSDGQIALTSKLDLLLDMTRESRTRDRRG